MLVAFCAGCSGHNLIVTTKYRSIQPSIQFNTLLISGACLQFVSVRINKIAGLSRCPNSSSCIYIIHKIFPRELFVYSSPHGWRLSPERRKMENNQSKHGKVGDRAEHRRTRALKQFKDQKPEHAFALRKR